MSPLLNPPQLINILFDMSRTMRVPSTLGLLSTQLGLGTAVIGFTRSQSWLRYAALPVLSSCVYGIVTKAPEQMRTRWCGLIGGLTWLYFLQYIDVAILSRWSYESHSNNESKQMKSNVASKRQSHQDLLNGHSNTSHKELSSTPTVDGKGFWSRFKWGLNTMLSFRHTNTPYEVRNVPPFKANNPEYIPPRWNFIAWQALVALTCYLTLDLMYLRPPHPPSDLDRMFNTSQIPVFMRFGEITKEQWLSRVFSTFGFAATFFSFAQGSYSFFATIAVGLGLSNVASWPPLFGSISDAYTLRSFWAKFWHQCLRQLITSPATWLSQGVLRLPRDSLISNLVVMTLAFVGSGVMHLVAGMSGGGGYHDKLGVFHFFLTQVCGILVEDRVRSIYTQISTTATNGEEAWYTKILTRSLGYMWVTAFMIWSVPGWIYPGAARPANGSPSMVPFSLVRAIGGKWLGLTIAEL